MQSTTKTRTQRRLEKRQTIILLALLLLVSLVSFVLGVTTGRRGAERDMALQLEEQETARIVQVPVAAPEPVSPPVATDEEVTAPERGDRLVDAVVESARLSFYDDLARESAPLGSGINQPPTPEVEQPTTQPPLDLDDSPIVVRSGQTETAARAAAQPQQQEAPAVTAADSVQALPSVAPQGTHVVQVGSFGSAADAASLRETMIDKGYPAFLAEADLGERGIWYRVRVGPYADSNTAGVARQIILDKEQIEGLVTRHTP
ncbi:MAG: SPOR domain-containing protein [Pelovirga sp.]